MTKIVFAKLAEYDLIDIEYYIYDKLCNPQAAQKVTDGILYTIEKIKEYPYLHPIIKNELIDDLELRMVRFLNYNIFYCYNSKNDILHIIRILYKNVDWCIVFKK